MVRVCSMLTEPEPKSVFLAWFRLEHGEKSGTIAWCWLWCQNNMLLKFIFQAPKKKKHKNLFKANMKHKYTCVKNDLIVLFPFISLAWQHRNQSPFQGQNVLWIKENMFPLINMSYKHTVNMMLWLQRVSNQYLLLYNLSGEVTFHHYSVFQSLLLILTLVC